MRIDDEWFFKEQPLELYADKECPFKYAPVVKAAVMDALIFMEDVELGLDADEFLYYLFEKGYKVIKHD